MNKIRHFFTLHAETICVCLLVILAIATHRQWFNWDSMLFFHDWKFRPDELIQTYLHLNNSTWLSFNGLGEPNIQLYNFASTYLWGVIGNYQTAVKLTFLIPIAVLSLLAPYYLTKYLTRSRMAALIAALSYGFSGYLIMRSTSHLPIAFVNALAPLIILNFIKLLREPTYFRSIIFGTIFSLGCYYELRIMYIVSFALIVCAITFGSIKILIAHRRIAVFLVLLIISLNIFWILPIFSIGSSEISAVANRGLWGNELSSIQHALANFDWKWTGTTITQTFDVNPIPIYYWTFPAVALICLVSIRHFKDRATRKTILAFASIAIVGIFLAKQASPPFPDAYAFLYKHFPGFSLFREASKFYLLICIGYTVLIAFSIKWIIVHAPRSKYLQFGVLAAIAGLFLMNTKPLVTGEVGGMFSSQNIPSYYDDFEEEIKNDPNFSRTLWAPLNGQLGYFDALHPKVLMWQELNANKAFQVASTVPVNINNFTNPELYGGTLDSLYGKHIIESMGVKYIVIPPQLDEKIEKVFPYAGTRQDYIARMNKIPGLVHSRIGDIDLYKTPYLAKYFDTKKAFFTQDMLNINDKYSFLQSIGQKGENFIVSNDNANVNKVPARSVDSVMAHPSIDNSDATTLRQAVELKSKEATLYKNINNFDVYVKRDQDSLSMIRKPIDNPRINNEQMNFGDKQNEGEISRVGIDTNSSYFIDTTNSLMPLNPIDRSYLGQSDQLSNISLYKKGSERISDPSFEALSQSRKVQDCHNYDSRPDINLRPNKEQKVSGEQSLELTSKNHDACYSTSASVSEGEYALQFSYQSPTTSPAGYSVVFDDDEATKIYEELPAGDADSWSAVTRKIKVPKGASTVQVYTYAFEDKSSDKGSVVRYDDLSLVDIENTYPINLPSNDPVYQRANIPHTTGNTLNLSYPLRDQLGDNILDNASFERGAWSKDVSDCDKYDENPDIEMRTNTGGASDGTKSLGLSATKHTACTSTNMSLPATGDYLLSLESKGNGEGGYHIVFNDTKKTTLDERMTVNLNNWNKYSTKITAPPGATSARLYLYAFESNGVDKSEVDYDNLSIQKIPNLGKTFYIMQGDDAKLDTPSLDYDLISATTKRITIKSVNQPFFLSMSEKYHVGWQILDSNNPNNTGIKHLKLNEWQNGWYVDPSKLCVSNPDSCQKNPDGTYRLELKAEFAPQKIFNAGLVVSTITLISGLCYVGYVKVKKRRMQSDNNLKI